METIPNTSPKSNTLPRLKTFSVSVSAPLKLKAKFPSEVENNSLTVSHPVLNIPSNRGTYYLVRVSELEGLSE